MKSKVLNTRTTPNSIIRNIVIFLFKITIVLLMVFGGDEKYHIISNACIALFCITIFSGCVASKKFKVGISLLFLFAAVFYILLSILWAVYPEIAIKKAGTILMMFVLAISTYEATMLFPELAEEYLNALFFAGIVMIAYSLVVYGGIGGFMSTMLIEGRMGGEICGENGYGLLFAEATLASFYLVYIKKKKYPIVGLCLFPLFAFSSGSKKALFLIVAGILCILILINGIKKVYKTIIISIVLVTIIYYIINLPQLAFFKLRLDAFFEGRSTGNLTNSSDKERALLIEKGIQLFKNGNTIFGHGLHNALALNGIGLYSHNNFVEVLVNYGLVGFFVYYSMYIKGLFGLWKNRKTGSEYKVLLVVFFAIIVMEYGMVTMLTKETWIIFGIILAIADGGVIKREENKNGINSCNSNI